jgi:putative aminopeptidase FrvX
VQEEIGLRGAITSTFGVDPDVGIAVDVTHAVDVPGDSKPKRVHVKTGLGPVIERGPNINRVVEERLIEAAEQKRIPYQLAGAPGATGTDANAIQISRAGVASGLIGIAVRYMHAPTEVLNLKDMENAAKLLTEFIIRLDGKTSFIPG